MDVTVLSLLVGGTVLLSVVLLIGLCLNCLRPSNHNNIITENHDNDDYTQPSGSFMVTRGEAYSTHDNFHPLSPRLNPSPLPIGRPIGEYTDDGQSSADEYVNQEEEDDRAYIVVLPGGAASATQSKLSLCPSHSSQGQDSNEYINVDPRENDNPTPEDQNHESDRDSEDYQNVSPDSEPEPPTILIGSQASLGSQSDDDDLDSGAYVNI
ncbi:uncharacterized protein LOC134070358 isoform X2 [Sardina pilchardus]